MNGSVTSEGITRDLEAMALTGIGGFHLFEVSDRMPAGPVVSYSDEWFDLMNHAMSEAHRLGLDLTLHNCSGWSSTGAPWITPELSMQQLSWSETYVQGGGTVEVDLQRPLANLDYFQDAKILAFPSLPGETAPLTSRVRRATVDGVETDVAAITDRTIDTVIEMRPADENSPARLVLEFAEPFTARTIAIQAAVPGDNRSAPAGMVLEASQDGSSYTPVAALTGGSGFGRTAAFPATAAFEAVTARFFRVSCSRSVDISELDLTAADRLEDWPYKTNLGRRALQDQDLDERTVTGIIDSRKVVDLTDRVDDGRLRWDAPAGEWTILRLGHTTTGRVQNQATDTGVGLEIDKYSREAMDFHFERFFGPLLDGLRPLADQDLAGALIDSYEVGMQNWTPGFDAEFSDRAGYDLTAYLPAMTGRIVGDVETTERFLWDVRRVQADLMADNYWGRFNELCHEVGLVSKTEPYGNGPFDELQAGSRTDYPMGEFWFRSGNHIPDLKIASSVAHLHGKPVVGAESFTGSEEYAKWTEHPFAMKAIGDLVYTHGLQDVIFHTFVHQPGNPDVLPGMTMGPHGIHMNRTTTWFDQAGPWLAYMASCQHILRQGKYVADLLYFVGENAPVETRTKGYFDEEYPILTPDPPAGHAYDLCDVEALLSRVEIRRGRIVLPDGMQYRAFVLPDGITQMSLTVLGRLHDLVRAGMWLLGAPPSEVYGLKDKERNETRLRALVRELWGDLDGETKTERQFGRGRVFWGASVGDVLDRLELGPDFTYSSRNPDANLHYIHRVVDKTDVYFVANQQRRYEDVVCRFRAGDRKPELLDAHTGAIIDAPVYDVDGDEVVLPLTLEPSGSVFVVFRSKARKERVEQITRDGERVLAARGLERSAGPNDVSDNFTIAAWVKPEGDTTTGPDDFGPEATEGRHGYMGAFSFVAYPPDGAALFGDGHATASFVVGRNAVAAYERWDDQFPRVLVADVAIAGWTHVALVYRDGVPHLYVDGEFVHRGLTSGRTIHPGAGFAAPDRIFVPHFEGDLEALTVAPKALSDAEIRELMAGGVPAPAAPPSVEPAFGASGSLLVWQNGRYEAKGHSSLRLSDLGEPAELAGPWSVSFPAGRGAPESVELQQLTSLHRHEDAGVRYFSGTAVYSTAFSAPRVGRDRRLFLDLGRVEVIADVTVNGQSLGTSWRRPHLLDITDAVSSGQNTLEVKVTNLWPNRLIGDEQLPPEYDYNEGGERPGGISAIPDWFVEGKLKPGGERITFTTWKHYSSDSPLLEAGLVGPVTLREAAVWSLD
ncbi:hypothetical protein HD601_003325 [Jiangella mangrovi]|uniref:Beta-mannosidase-like galactose-binding domain-containing protein n=2 Tax=Jiangella mangrovi TaxID=1524084 RepID=A0A7W9GRK3_9ACTN|nr:hypothetical protein [Jiangella mangrovi]